MDGWGDGDDFHRPIGQYAVVPPAVQVGINGAPIVKEAALDRSLLAAAIESRLIGMTAERLVSMLYTEVEAIVDFAALCRGDKTGHKISMLFNPHRYETDTINGDSIITAFKDPGFCKGLARALAFKSDVIVRRDLLYQVFQLGINAIQYVCEFPPHVARDIYKEFGARRVLDPCAGWGGRMIGAAAVGAHYHAFEPSTRTYNGLLRLGEFLKSFNTGFDFQLENKPFEEAELTKVYDIALTSPPYYDTERYADEPTQACMRYKSFEEFRDGFYLPMINKAVAHSKKGLVLNIGSRRYPMRQAINDNYRGKVRMLEGSFLSGAAGLGKSGEGEVFLLIEDAA